MSGREAVPVDRLPGLRDRFAGQYGAMVTVLGPEGQPNPRLTCPVPLQGSEGHCCERDGSVASGLGRLEEPRLPRDPD